MDRFKFRVWRPTNVYIRDWKPRFIYQDILKADYCIIKQDNDVYEQCTGLKDKNGKLIYEGDIVKIDDDYAEIKWSELCGRWEIESEDDIFDFDNTYAEECKIIGNIHENADLLGADR